MWNSVVNIVVTSVGAAFNWYGQIMDAVPGAWDTIFTIIVILILSRFLLGPILGAAFSGSSDQAQIRRMKHQNKLRSAAKRDS